MQLGTSYTPVTPRNADLYLQWALPRVQNQEMLQRILAVNQQQQQQYYLAHHSAQQQHVVPPPLPLDATLQVCLLSSQGQWAFQAEPHPLPKH